MKRIAIVGAAPGSCMLAPYDDDSWEIWGLNFAWKWQPRIDRLFEMHATNYLKQNQQEHWAWLLKHDGSYPIIMQQVLPEVKNSVEFPLQQVMDKWQTKYYTNSISYMLALAALEKPDEVGLWGVDMAQSHQPDERNEYAWQRPSCEYFCGVLAGQGAKLFVAPQSDLLKTRQLYGYNIATGDMPAKMKAREQEIQARINQTNQQIEMATQKYNEFIQEQSLQRAALMGALEEANYSKQWIPQGEDDGHTKAQG